MTDDIKKLYEEALTLQRNGVRGQWGNRQIIRLCEALAAVAGERDRMREAMTWISCADRLPEVGSEVEIAKPVRYDGAKWSRDFARFGENVVGEPFNGFCNDNWHCDVTAKRARIEGWMWRPMTNPPTLNPEAK